MPKELTEADLADYSVTYTNGYSSIEKRLFRGAYFSTEDKMPGLLLLKDHEHRIVAMFQSGMIVTIKREGAEIGSSDENRIRDAMAEAQEYPGRIVTR